MKIEVERIVDEVWMLVNEHGVIYCIERSPQALWQRVIDEEIMGTGVTRTSLKKQGYRARKVVIALPRHDEQGRPR